MPMPMPSTNTLPPMPHILFSRQNRAFVLAVDTRRRCVTYTDQPQRAMRLGWPQDAAQALHVCRVAGEQLELREPVELSQVVPLASADPAGAAQ